MAPTQPPPAGNPAGGPPAPPPLCPTARNTLLAADPERAAALLGTLNAWAELLSLTGEPNTAPRRPRPPRRPAISPNIPRQKPRTPHGPGDGQRRRCPRYIRMCEMHAPA